MDFIHKFDVCSSHLNPFVGLWPLIMIKIVIRLNTRSDEYMGNA